jgi:hypothetical protein
MRLRVLIAAVAAAAALGGCGGASAPSAAPDVRTPPSLAAFFREPPATPSACPSTANGTSDGRSSPWVGHVDVSVFLKTSATTGAIRGIGASLRRAPIVQHVYFESRARAYAEFQRLYTCWAQVPTSATPPSYRVVLTATATIGQRNTLVARMLQKAAVDTASCDPSLPCVDVVRSAQPRR